MITPLNNIPAYAFYCHVVNLHFSLTIHSRKSRARYLGNGVINTTYEKIETRGGSGSLYYAFFGITCTTLKDRRNENYKKWD